MNIRVDLNYPIQDGTEVVFRSPVDCSQVTGLKVYHIGADGNTTSQEFAFADAHGNNVGDIDHLFAENVVVKVILDVTTSMAFVQNADTNAYLESRFNGLSDSIVCEASGGIISMNDSSDRSFQKFNLYGKTTQNGTPTPDAPVALESTGDNGNIGVEVIGKNLFNTAKIAEGNVSFTKSEFSLNEDVITCTFVSGGIHFYCGNFPAGTYTFSVDSSDDFYVAVFVRRVSDNTNIVVRNPNYDTLRNFTFTANEPFRLAFGGVYSGGVSHYGTYTFRLQLEVGTTATEYESYKEPQTLTASTPNGLNGIPVSSGGNYTDENGQQWICDEIDFARGKYIKRIGARTISGLSAPAPVIALINIPDKIHKEDVGILSSHAVTILTTDQSSATYGQCYETPSAVFFRGADDDTKATVGERYENSTLMYVLAEPVETNLSVEELEVYAKLHPNKPNTTVLNDCEASMAVEYKADTKTYIDNKFNALSATLTALTGV